MNLSQLPTKTSKIILDEIEEGYDHDNGEGYVSIIAYSKNIVMSSEKSKNLAMISA